MGVLSRVVLGCFFRVGGGLEGLAVTCIAVGLAFTVAVTADGTAWQMGETGVSGKAAPWEGALVPAKVTSKTPPALALQAADGHGST